MRRFAGLLLVTLLSSVALGDWSNRVLDGHPDAMSGFTGTQHFFFPSVNFPGDANFDGKVDVGDLGILAANYGEIGGINWANGDFNSDGRVDVGDLGILAANYGNVGDISKQRILDVLVDYAVFAPGKFIGEFDGILSEGYNPETDYVYAYQVYNYGPVQGGKSTVFLSYFGVNEDTSNVTAVGQDAGFDDSQDDFRSTGSSVLETGVAFYFPMADEADPKLTPGLFSTVLLISSPVAPSFVPFTIVDSGLSDTQSLPFAAAVPVPASTLLGAMGLGLLGLVRRAKAC
jgi:hypothetical protein